jgi:hypothetical protein
VVKSMASQTKIVHVLLGTYELLAFRNLSGQLSRRSLDIHFRRYRCEDKRDLKIFRNILLTFKLSSRCRSPATLHSGWTCFMSGRSGAWVF